MKYISKYSSPLGDIILTADKTYLTGLWFKDMFKDTFKELETISQLPTKEPEIFEKTKKWLDIYFSGIEPDFKLPLKFSGTPFQNEIWEILCQIPYGETTTYGTIAKQIAAKRGISKMATQAVGGAISKNKILIVTPCHRVIGKNGNLTGFSGGIDKKIALLKLENGYKDVFYTP